MMAQSLYLDLRTRIAAASKGGMTVRAASERFGYQLQQPSVWATGPVW